jgi:hypothetical protein
MSLDYMKIQSFVWKKFLWLYGRQMFLKFLKDALLKQLKKKYLEKSIFFLKMMRKYMRRF